MNEEKKINIEDGNLEETAEKETEQQTTSDTCEKSEAGENEENNETEEKDNTPEEKDPLDAANEQIEKLKDQLLRTIAEFDNYKKRTMKEKAELILNGSEKTVTAILPVLDDFERAMADQTDDPQAIKEGMELIFKKFVKTLEGLGVKKIDTDDKDFDVDFHEAIAMVPGYMLNDKVIRHAKVAVGQ